MNRRLVHIPARALRMAGIALLASLPIVAPALADDASGFNTEGNVMIYYAVLPAEMIRTYPKGSPEALMHGGVPGGKHVHHLQVALFDNDTMARIDDATVSATISDHGQIEQTVELEPFTVDDAVTYGAYVEFAKLETYRIDIRVEQPGSDQPTETHFDYRHH